MFDIFMDNYEPKREEAKQMQMWTLANMMYNYWLNQQQLQ